MWKILLLSFLIMLAILVAFLLKGVERIEKGIEVVCQEVRLIISKNEKRVIMLHKDERVGYSLPCFSEGKYIFCELVFEEVDKNYAVYNKEKNILAIGVKYSEKAKEKCQESRGIFYEKLGICILEKELAKRCINL